MQLFNSVVRKYTPPTCTLEVKARESPLSRWVPLKVLKQLTFELYIDDPKHQQAPEVSLWGDGEELEMLHEAVSSYVQDLIDKSHNQLELALGQPANQSSSTQLQPDEKNNHHLKALSSSEANLARLAKAEEVESEEIESGYRQEESQPRLMLAASPYLKPRGLLAHDLVLGSLETDDSGPVISLSVLQLFDLATALDEYAADVMVMPSLSSPPLSFRNRPTWVYAAAGGVIAAVGLTLALGQMFSAKKQQPQIVVMSPTAQPTLNEDAPLAGDSLPPLSPTPLASLSPGATPVLPPPPGATTLNPNLPNSAVPTPLNSASLPTSPGIGQPPLGNPQIGSSSVPFNPPTSPQIPLNNSSPFNPPNSSFPLSRSNNPRPSFSIPSFNSTPPIKVITPRKPTSVAKRASPPPLRIVTPPEPKISVSRLPLRIVTPPEPKIASVPSARVTTPKKAPAPPSLSQLKPGKATDLSGLPILQASPPNPPQGLNTDSFSQASPEVAPSIASNSSNLALNAGNSASIDDKTRTFDTIPQVAEARKYFQQRWKPPQGLTQSLEYRLFVRSDGSIERIMPLTKAAELNIGSTNIPLPGAQFVSPLAGKPNAQIRVVLNADGKVEALLE